MSTIRKASLYIVFDTVAQDIAGAGILTLKNDNAALRLFTDVIRDGKTAVAHHAADMELVLLGHLDEAKTGMGGHRHFTLETEHTVLANGADILANLIAERTNATT